MNIVPLLLLCSLVLVVGSVLLFVFSAKQGDCSDADRLCLLPLDDDAEVSACDEPAAPPTSPSRGND